MSKEIAKQGYELAEKELREKQISEVKQIVLKTLEKIDKLSKERKELDDQIRILKLDLDDIKDGKLDRIVERQEKDTKARDTSVVIIIKEKEIIREVSPWYYPYTIKWQVPTYPHIVFGGNSDVLQFGGFSGYYSDNSGHVIDMNATVTTSTINCSVAKDASIGTYALEGKVVNFR